MCRKIYAYTEYGKTSSIDTALAVGAFPVLVTFCHMHVTLLSPVTTMLPPCISSYHQSPPRLSTGIYGFLGLATIKAVSPTSSRLRVVPYSPLCYKAWYVLAGQFPPNINEILHFPFCLIFFCRRYESLSSPPPHAESVYFLVLCANEVSENNSNRTTRLTARELDIAVRTLSLRPRANSDDTKPESDETKNESYDDETTNDNFDPLTGLPEECKTPCTVLVDFSVRSDLFILINDLTS